MLRTVFKSKSVTIDNVYVCINKCAFKHINVLCLTYLVLYLGQNTLWLRWPIWTMGPSFQTRLPTFSYISYCMAESSPDFSNFDLNSSGDRLGPFGSYLMVVYITKDIVTKMSYLANGSLVQTDWRRSVPLFWCMA